MTVKLVRVPKYARSERVRSVRSHIDYYIVHHPECGHVRRATNAEPVPESDLGKDTVRRTGWERQGDEEVFHERIIRQVICGVCRGRRPRRRQVEDAAEAAGVAHIEQTPEVAAGDAGTLVVTWDWADAYDDDRLILSVHQALDLASSLVDAAAQVLGDAE